MCYAPMMLSLLIVSCVLRACAARDVLPVSPVERRTDTRDTGTHEPSHHNLTFIVDLRSGTEMISGDAQRCVVSRSNINRNVLMDLGMFAGMPGTYVEGVSREVYLRCPSSTENPALYADCVAMQVYLRQAGFGKTHTQIPCGETTFAIEVHHELKSDEFYKSLCEKSYPYYNLVNSSRRGCPSVPHTTHTVRTTPSPTASVSSSPAVFPPPSPPPAHDSDGDPCYQTSIFFCMQKIGICHWNNAVSACVTSAHWCQSDKADCADKTEYCAWAGAMGCVPTTIPIPTTAPPPTKPIATTTRRGRSGNGVTPTTTITADITTSASQQLNEECYKLNKLGCLIKKDECKWSDDGAGPDSIWGCTKVNPTSCEDLKESDCEGWDLAPLALHKLGCRLFDFGSGAVCHSSLQLYAPCMPMFDLCDPTKGLYCHLYRRGPTYQCQLMIPTSRTTSTHVATAKRTIPASKTTTTRTTTSQPKIGVYTPVPTTRQRDTTPNGGGFDAVETTSTTTTVTTRAASTTTSKVPTSPPNKTTIQPPHDAVDRQYEMKKVFVTTAAGLLVGLLLGFILRRWLLKYPDCCSNAPCWLSSCSYCYDADEEDVAQRRARLARRNRHRRRNLFRQPRVPRYERLPNPDQNELEMGIGGNPVNLDGVDNDESDDQMLVDYADDIRAPSDSDDGLDNNEMLLRVANPQHHEYLNPAFIAPFPK